MADCSVTWVDASAAIIQAMGEAAITVHREPGEDDPRFASRVRAATDGYMASVRGRRAADPATGGDAR